MKTSKLFITALIIVILSCSRESENYYTAKSGKSVAVRYINNPTDSEVVIYTTGMPDAEYQEASMITAKKYGFSYWPAAGCYVSDSVRSSVNKRNKITNGIIAKINGENWKLRFKQEVDILQNRVSKAKRLFYSSPLYSYLNFHDKNSKAGFYVTPNEVDTNLINIDLYISNKWKNYFVDEYFGTVTINVQNNTFSLTDSVGRTEFVINNRR